MRQEFEHRLQSDLSEARARLDKLAAAQKNEYESKMRQKLKQAQVDIAEMLNCYTAVKVQLLICMVEMLHSYIVTFYSTRVKIHFSHVVTKMLPRAIAITHDTPLQTQQEQDAIRQNTLNDANGQLRIQNDALKAQVSSQFTLFSSQSSG